MALTSITIAGFEVWPETIDYRPMWIGGDLRRALDGTAYRKNVAQKYRLALSWSYATAEEHQEIKVIWEQARQGAVTITCSDPLISGTFTLTSQDFPLEPLDGEDPYYKGVMTFEEQ